MRLLGVFPHPDDESYAAGGTLALCAQRGDRVRLVCATRGEQGVPGVAPAEVAAMRSRELAASCAALGVEAPEFLDLPDSRGASWDTTAARARLLALLRAFSPDVLITLGADGVYGHVDHLACTRLVDAVVAASARPPRLLHAAFPRGLFAPLCQGLSFAAPHLIAAGIDPASLGCAREEAHVIVPITAVGAQKRAAVTAHRSQFGDLDPEAIVLPEFFAALFDEEWFVCAAGPPLPPGAQDPAAGL